MRAVVGLVLVAFTGCANSDRAQRTGMGSNDVPGSAAQPPPPTAKPAGSAMPPATGTTLLGPVSKSLVEEIAVSAEANVAVAYLRSGELIELDLAGKALKPSGSLPGARAIALSRDGTSTAAILVGPEALSVNGNPVALPEMRVKRDEGRYDQDTGSAHAVAFAPNGDLLVIASYDHYPMRRELRLVRLGPKHTALANYPMKWTTLRVGHCRLELAHDGKLAIATSCADTNFVIRLSDGKVLRSDTSYGDCVGAAVGIEADTVSIGCFKASEDNGDFKVMKDGQLQPTLAKEACRLAPTGQLVACPSHESSRVLEMRDAGSGKVLDTAKLPDFISTLAFLPDGSRALVGMQDGQIAIVDTPHR